MYTVYTFWIEDLNLESPFAIRVSDFLWSSSVTEVGFVRLTLFGDRWTHA